MGTDHKSVLISTVEMTEPLNWEDLEFQARNPVGRSENAAESRDIGVSVGRIDRKRLHTIEVVIIPCSYHGPSHAVCTDAQQLSLSQSCR